MVIVNDLTAPQRRRLITELGFEPLRQSIMMNLQVPRSMSSAYDVVDWMIRNKIEQSVLFDLIRDCHAGGLLTIDRIVSPPSLKLVKRASFPDAWRSLGSAKAGSLLNHWMADRYPLDYNIERDNINVDRLYDHLMSVHGSLNYFTKACRYLNLFYHIFFVQEYLTASYVGREHLVFQDPSTSSEQNREYSAVSHTSHDPVLEHLSSRILCSKTGQDWIKQPF